MISYWKHFLQIGLKTISKNSDAMEFRKCLWLRYLLVTDLETALTMFAAYVQHQYAKNLSNWNRTAVCFKSFSQTSGCGVNWPLWALAYNCKNCTNFLSNFFNAYLGCVIAKVNKSQKISTCFFKYVLFIFEKTKQKESIDPFASFRVKKWSVFSFPNSIYSRPTSFFTIQALFSRLFCNLGY